jgi:hypothetical protein
VTDKGRPIGGPRHRWFDAIGSSEEPPADLKDLLAAVDGAYAESDSDRALVERSLELASNELMERNTLRQRCLCWLRLSTPRSIAFWLALTNRQAEIQTSVRCSARPESDARNGSVWSVNCLV